ncbi:type II secretion system F family protein [Aliishimia ponticola]|uniref:Type II secretion system F family protein n=1 Tax=Aliishimia ponticola TaxID=2499833 RepID=A0A4S4NCQ8_9RHOB|nr:type II secretion system F family protein [Aliishimia ponticola]THH37234.1 type II secretion system F family protein [Aliishimia ponticola]
MGFLKTINDFLVEYLGDLGPIILVGVLGLVIVAITVSMMLAQPEDPLEKLKKSAKAGTTQKGEKERLRQGGRNEQLERFSKFLEPEDVAELSKLQLTMRQAGYQAKDAVLMYHAAQFVLGIVGLIAGVTYVAFFIGDPAEVGTQKMVMYALGPGFIGYYLPKYWITKRVEERKEQITQGFPDSLDMMLVCVEAGQSLDQAITRVAKELRASCAALADEYEIVSYEMKAGKDKSSVLQDMGERCGVQDVSSFVTVLVQSATFGTSISEALRVYASEMRDKRVMRAEEAANKLPTKMTLATMMLTVPPLLVILVGPSVHGITQLGNMSK